MTFRSFAVVALALATALPAAAQQGCRSLSPEERARRRAEADRRVRAVLQMTRPIEALNSSGSRS